MALEDLGDLIIQVGGDITPLEDALNQIPAVVDAAASAFDDFMKASAPLDAVQGAATAAAGAMEELGAAAGGGGGPVDGARASIGGLASMLPDLKKNEDDTTESTNKMVAGFAGLYILREISTLLETFVTDTLTAYSQVQQLSLDRKST